MTDINNISEEFMEFIFLGLDHGIESIKDGGGPLVPFVMTKTNEEKNLSRILTDTLEDGVREAENLVKQLNPKPKLALIAFDGYATIDSKRYDAIIVRSFDSSEADGLIFAQRYVPKEIGIGINPMGNSALVGYEPNLLKESNSIKLERKKLRWKF